MSSSASPLPPGEPYSSGKRVDEWGLLRGLSFFAIVMQHSLGEYIYRDNILYADAAVLGMLYHFIRYGTLTFVFLAGAILFYQYGRSEKKYGPVLLKRIGDIYVPFACWTLLYWIVVQYLSNKPLLSYGELPLLLQQFIAPTHGYHLWFVVMIFQFYLLFPLFRAAAKKIGRWTGAVGTEPSRLRRVLLLMLLLALAYGWLMYLSYYRMPGWQTSGLWQTLLAYRSYEFPYYLFYFVLGGVCGLHLDRFRAITLKLLPWSTLAFIGVYLWLNYDLLQNFEETINLNVSTYLKPSSFIAVTVQILMLYGWVLLLQKNGGALKKLLLLCGKYSFGAYLSHAMILMGVSLITRNWALTGGHLIASVLTALIVATLALLLCAGLSRLPGGRWLTGGAGKKARSVARRANSSN
ncbi:acyltransferase [Saccharibacillus kuerlensis]|uniref:Membrane protein n=1 Tax=Saccharibacillus kuerlensis TaxID=459527 RepID=A0ABQ2L3Q1_9BACL|nr:acyltransferase [Saccharibacillus kuerlensis]GGO01354.1 membrane protein [Saccharibacillus kuerlensis]